MEESSPPQGMREASGGTGLPSLDTASSTALRSVQSLLACTVLSLNPLLEYRAPFVPFAMAILVVRWLWAGLVATILSVEAGLEMFIGQDFSPECETTAQIALALIYLSLGGLHYRSLRGAAAQPTRIGGNLARDDLGQRFLKDLYLV